MSIGSPRSTENHGVILRTECVQQDVAMLRSMAREANQKFQVLLWIAAFAYDTSTVTNSAILFNSRDKSKASKKWDTS